MSIDAEVLPAKVGAIAASDEIREQFRAPKNTLFLHPKQMEVYRTPKRFRVVCAGRRWGKSQLAKVSIIRYARIKKRLIWYVAPSYRMARQIMWPELLESIPRAWIYKVNETMLTIRLINGTRIELKGADNPDALRGVGIHFLVMDEVQDIHPDAWNKVLRPTLASTGGHALFIGSPKSYNFLYELFQLGARDDMPAWQSWQFPTITSPFIPKHEIEAARHDMDEKSFRQEFEACHLPETQVVLWSGKVKAIKDIVAGDQLRHLSDDGQLVPCEALQIGQTGLKQVVDVTIETGDVIAASNHHKFKVHA